MLKRLHIKNYAIIEEIEVDFSNGLNVITGETGAGKSILIGALNLILGQRADSSVLLDIEKKCIVEGIFSMRKDSQLGLLLNNYEIELGLDIFLRREISSNGKSRSFINDTPVNLSQIKLLSVHIVDLHQQFDTLEINTENFQREVLDALSDTSVELQNISVLFDTYSSERKQLQLLQQQQDAANKELDYNTFLFDELNELSLKENELENLEAELKLLTNAENIKLQLSAIYSVLGQSEQPIVNQLKSLGNKLKSLEAFHPGIEGLQQRLTIAAIELQDVSDELESIDESIRYDNERIIEINDRLSSGYKLMKKHNVNSTAQLIELHQQLQLKLDGYSNIFEAIEKLEKSSSDLYKECQKIAVKISKKRKESIPGFIENVNRL
jgi:DNA repair protein RecN (Recombination protein N)